MPELGHLAFALIAILISSITDALPKGQLPDTKLMHSVMLDQQGDYLLSWTPREKDVVFEVQVATTGYVGLGFSPSGAMKGSDIILGWVDDDSGEVYLHDRFAAEYGVPSIDASQNVELLGGYQNDSHTILRFTRPWKSCDDKEDRDLSEDTMRFIWSFNYQDPTNEMTMPIHSRRGTKSLYLNEPPFIQPELTDDVKPWDLVSQNISLPNDLDTLYWCKIFKIPQLDRKAHIIGYVPLVQEENVEQVHHIVVYECVLDDAEKHYEKWLDVKGAQCYSENMPVSWSRCRTPLIVWAVGSDGEMFPDHVGFPIGSKHGGSTYFLMEIHYDNPNMRQDVVDGSGVRIFYTEKLRQHEAANMAIGSDVSGNMIIPPGQDWLAVGHCVSECTMETLPSDGINVFHGLLHAHVLGKSLKLRQIRNGLELPTVFQDRSYDFNYQQARVLKEEMKILPGDSFIVECGYDSTRTTKPTFGGLATNEEMCEAFLSYYPRVNLSLCTSRPSLQNIYESVGIEDIYQKDAVLLEIDDEKDIQKMEALKEDNYMEKITDMKFWHAHKMVKAKSPEKYVNTTLYDILNDDAIWKDSEWLRRLQNLTINGRHHTTCYEKGGKSLTKEEIPSMVDYPSFVPLVPETRECGIN